MMSPNRATILSGQASRLYALLLAVHRQTRPTTPLFNSRFIFHQRFFRLTVLFVQLGLSDLAVSLFRSHTLLKSPLSGSVSSLPRTNAPGFSRNAARNPVQG